MRATISIVGLTEFNENLWEKLQLPTQANRQDIIDEICLECMDFELLYPDWDVMHHAIGLWSRKELPIWQRLYDAKEIEYNPLWNVDAEIKEVRDVTDNSNYTDNTLGSNNKTDSRDGNVDRDIDTTETGTDTGATTKNSTTDLDADILHQSNTFNSGQMIDNSKDITDSTEVTSETENFSGSRTRNIGTDDNTVSHEEGSEQGNYTEDKQGTKASATHDDYHVIRQGNIGVTSSQQLLTEEWEVSQLDPEQYIIDSFKQRFCLLLY